MEGGRLNKYSRIDRDMIEDSVVKFGAVTADKLAHLHANIQYQTKCEDSAMY